MDFISQHKVFHGGTYNTNPVSMAAGLATFAEVLTRENYGHVEKLGEKLVDGYQKIVAKVGLQAYIAQAGANGALMLYPQEIRNYRDWLTVDVDLWVEHESTIGAGLRDVDLQAHLGDDFLIAIDQFLAEFLDVRVVFASQNLGEGRQTGGRRNRIRVVGAAVKNLVLRDEVHHRLVACRTRPR